MNRLRTFLSDKRGYAAVEFGMVGGILLIFMIGIVDVGRMTVRSMQTKYAAEAGAMYVVKKGFNADGVSAAVQAATASGIVTSSPSPSLFCGCPTTSGITIVATCTSGSDCSGVPACQNQMACVGTLATATYVKIQTTASFTPFFNASFIHYPQSINATAVVRTK